MNHRNPRPSGWVFARVALGLAIAGVLGYRWHEGWLSWPLILMCAFISGLLVLEIFTVNRRSVQRDFYPDGRPVQRRRATDYVPAEVAPEDRVTTIPDGR